MKEPYQDEGSVLDHYGEVLQNALEGLDEEAMEAAHLLARRALADGCGLLDLAVVHHEALAAAATTLSPARVRRAEGLFLEMLSPYEMSLSGYREANDGLRRLTGELETRVAERTAELDRAQARYRELVEQVPAITYRASWTEGWRFTYISPQVRGILGFAEDDWMDPSDLWQRRLHPDDRDRALAMRQRALKGPGQVSEEYRLLNRDGDPLWFRDEAVVSVHHQDGPPVLRGILLDITQRRELETRLRSTQRMESIGQLAGGIAHDFNNLLCVVVGRTELTMDMLGEVNPAVSESLEAVLKAAQGGAGLISQLLAFSRRKPNRPEVVNVVALLNGLGGILRGAVREDHALQYDLPDQPLLTRIDPGQLEQVVLNLVVNARDAMPRGGHVVLRLRQHPTSDADVLKLEIADTGEGIPEAHLSRIFEPYFTTKAPGRGTGLGLATCYGIIQDAGGHIDVDSTVGRGTTFCISLPRVWDPVTPRQIVAPDAVAPGGNERILVVEDNQSVRQMLVQLLRRAGYHVESTDTPAEVLDRIEQGRFDFDLMISDVVMPGISGPQLIRMIRRRAPDLRLLLITGYADPHLLDADVEDVELLPKPFDSAQLARRVRALLDRGRRGAPGG